VRILKTTLTVVILAAALVAGTIALFWETLLTPEQKLRYGLVFPALEDYGARARAFPDNQAFLADYVDVLVQAGNLGRAAYLSELHGVPCERLPALREAVRRSLEAAANQEVYALHEDPALADLQDLPIAQAFRYAEGYQHALLGDWASARNQFAAIDERQLAPQLRPYLRYYLARSYRLAGDEKQQARIPELLLSIAEGHPDAELAAKARYNLIAWYLSDAYPDKDGLALARDQELSMSLSTTSWATQKSFIEFGEYFLRQGDYESAWTMAYPALQLDPEALPGKSAAELSARLLTDVLDGAAGWGITADGALTLPLPPGVFTDLARAAAKHGLASSAAALLDRLKPHVSAANRNRWEELRVGMAICFRADADAEALRALMADANLRDLSDPSLSAIYYQHALLLEARQEWNTALDYYRSCARLGGAEAGDALYHCYAILKHVQDPLDLDRSVDYLRRVIEQHPASESVPKALEELLPLLIHRGDQDAARRLIDWAQDRRPAADATEGERRTLEQMIEVAAYWDAYLLERAGRGQAAEEVRARIGLKYWNYYELTSNYPPQPSLPAGCTLLGYPAGAGEYLAGLGLTDSAREYYAGTGDPDNPALAYLSLANAALSRPLHSRQWHATELLESGAIGEQALLDYVLSEAYPRPFAAEVEAAAAEFGVPANLVWAVMKKESNFNEAAVSWACARGLMQIMAPTARWLDSKYGMSISTDQLDDPAVNIRLGAAYLAALYEIFGANNTRAVIHAYNGGDGNYRKWRERYGGDPALLTELIPSEENEGFGKKVTRYFKVYEWLGARTQ